MAKQPRQKWKLLELQRILLEQTDEDHALSTKRLIGALARREIRAERKSIYDDMATLTEFGLDVQRTAGKHGGWFVGERSFQLAELKLLVDAVQSSRFISAKKSRALIQKLEKLASVHQARSLQRQVYVAGRAKTMNESVYYTIDQLHAALSVKRAVSFRYFEYSVKKEKVFRREGRPYLVSPYGLIWDNESYYLAGYDHEKEDMRHYRVDKMADLTITAQPRRGEALGAEMDTAAYGQKHFGMFSGREGQIRLRCENRLVGVVLDRFGQEVMLIPDGAEHFTVTVQAVVSPQFLGWLFGLGEGVSLLGPSWAVDQWRGQLDALWRREGIFPEQRKE
ncbi:WYL domain-containing protein [Pseudoflavonifractor sp. 524-17]|uniref:helix-turn-helix transcriptional regulator n=1 Tax=Pseudoflavonifractor sp. 524-17 TaxID=2304577 RepID=UPI00137A0194|nr:WYL domain-containing protein [Pseudoflavonifractor sp. 524-17]NCE64878.1 WYL domain-containing protein [Pseudoflavonifractor sp. 524-17]